MAPKPGERGELSPHDGRPIPNPEPAEAAILSDRSLAVRFEGGPWIRPTAEEIRLYGPVLGTQPVRSAMSEWFFRCPASGRVRFTTKRDDKQNSRIGKSGGNNDEQNIFRRLFDGDPTPSEPKAFTSILSVSDIKAMSSASNPEGSGWLDPKHNSEAVPPPNVPLPADVAPIDIPPTPFAHAYSSKGLATMTDKFPLLEHVNCSYLSTLHHAPTLLELKQHAQALAVLISEMSGPSTNSAQVNNEGLGDRVFSSGEPFDWLNDLNKPYVNFDAEHSIPLTTLMNTYHHDRKTVRTTQICPLSSLPRTREAKDAGQPGLPYMTHEALTKHANECLEILDHEFSAEGGLLAILPAMENVSGRKLSGRTLLGQYILFTQRLVQRVHELELRAANAADLLSGEKVIPDQTIGLIPGLNGRDGTRPTPVAYPQHKFVLANAGAPAWDELTKMLNIKEKMDRDLHTYNLQNGLSASSQWETGRTMEFRSGLTHIDVITRYTRCWDANTITGTPTPIFIIPGHAVHPGTAATREMEKNPHVVQVVKPQYPERLSVLEEKYENKRYEYEGIINEHHRLKQENEEHLETIAVQQLMFKDLQAENSYRRAEQQGRGVEDLAKFRNPVAEKEKKLDETQRDLDQKLLTTEYALRDAQRMEKAAQGELEKLAKWKENETVKLQAIIQQNAALTAGVRAGYVKNAGIATVGVPVEGPRLGGKVDKLGLWEYEEELTDLTGQVEEPLRSDFNGLKIFLNARGVHTTQTIINGVPGTQYKSDNVEVYAFEQRLRKIRSGEVPAPDGPLVVYTLFPGLGMYDWVEYANREREPWGDGPDWIANDNDDGNDKPGGEPSWGDEPDWTANDDDDGNDKPGGEPSWGGQPDWIANDDDDGNDKPDEGTPVSESKQDNEARPNTEIPTPPDEEPNDPIFISSRSAPSNTRRPPSHSLGEISSADEASLTPPWPFPFPRITNYKGPILTSLMGENDKVPLVDTLDQICYDKKNGVTKKTMVKNPVAGPDPYVVVKESKVITDAERYALQTRYDLLASQGKLGNYPDVSVFVSADDPAIASGRREQTASFRNALPDWTSIENTGQYEILIAAAMESIGWESRVIPEGPLKGKYEWVKSGSDPLEVLPADAWKATLVAAGAPVPIIRTIMPDWTKASSTHVRRAMADAGWTVWIYPQALDGSGLAWSRGDPNKYDELEWVPNEDPRAWLTFMAHEGAVKGSGFDKASEAQIGTAMTNFGYTLVPFEDVWAEKIVKRWVVIADGRSGIPSAEKEALPVDQARSFLKEKFNKV